MDIRQEFDHVIAVLSRMTAIEYLGDMVAAARKTDERVCGNCSLWLRKGSCPRERGMMTGGPSMVAPACDKFDLKDWVADLKTKRIAELTTYANERGLPVPQNL